MRLHTYEYTSTRRALLTTKLEPNTNRMREEGSRVIKSNQNENCSGARQRCEESPQKKPAPRELPQITRQAKEITSQRLNPIQIPKNTLVMQPTETKGTQLRRIHKVVAGRTLHPIRVGADSRGDRRRTVTKRRRNLSGRR